MMIKFAVYIVHVFLLIQSVTCLSSSNLYINNYITKIKKAVGITIAGSLFIPSSILAVTAPVPSIGECITDSNSQATVITCRKLGLIGDSLQGCQANENCLSSSAKAASKYISSWYLNYQSI